MPVPVPVPVPEVLCECESTPQAEIWARRWIRGSSDAVWAVTAAVAAEGRCEVSVFDIEQLDGKLDPARAR